MADSKNENENGALPKPSLPPRPADSSAHVAATAKPPMATRKLVSNIPAPASASATSKALEPPPRRPGAPIPGSLSVARSTVNSYYNTPAPAPVPATATPFPTASSLSTSPAVTASTGTALLPPPVRRLPGFAYGSPSHSPVMTTTSLDPPSGFNNNSPGLNGNTESIPRLPPRRHPVYPLANNNSNAIYPSFDRKSFLPVSSPLPSAGLSASTATATLLPPPVRTQRPSPSGSSHTARLSGSGPTLLPPGPSTSRGATVAGSSGSSSSISTSPANIPRPTAAIVAPAARKRYEALFDRELAAQTNSSASRKRRSSSKRPAHPHISAETSLSRSLGNGPDLQHPYIARIRGPPPSSNFSPAAAAAMAAANNGGKSALGGASRHRFGNSDPSFNICRGNVGGSRGEPSSEDVDGSVASSAAVTPSPANVNALKGFFEGKSSDPPPPPPSSTQGPTSKLAVAQTSASSTSSSSSSTLSLPATAGLPRLPERRMTKSNTDSGLQINNLNLNFNQDALLLRAPSRLAVRSPGNNSVNGGGSRIRAVSASASTDEGMSASGLLMGDSDRLGAGSVGGGAGSGGTLGFLRSEHERDRSGGTLRSLSSKDLRADAALHAAICGLPSAPTSSNTTSSTTAMNLRLSPRRTRDVWRRSRLREVFLAKLWDVMGGNADGITRESFVRGMAAIDFELAKRSASARGAGRGNGPGGGNDGAFGRGRPGERGW
ncbi:unnamed protein product [Tilletia caries]|uniref:Uncharacterized protein n=2 Tax=Tilletia caries TaxID=13290 RepID=A0A177VAQ3_9BASI|nr:hypothetical protein CF336_g2018 [Tilletia laevis]KAE8205458.1 hypothetical protein CF328_g493 [Tilletia controversa]KAE8263653.1 hypothetical protein A4X03_0g1523 [Tilletia caries]KAE8207194.1 hypothetical protein CF335_g1316 [Tilletia laevis]CAD6893858.1 unnamed protein product [Tilletia caries]